MEESKFQIFQDERFIDLTIYQFGYQRCRPMHSFGPAIRNHHLFHFIISGKGTFSCNDQDHHPTDYSLSAGTGFLIEPGYVTHYWADMHDPWEYMWIEFGGLRVKEFMEAAGLSHMQPIYRPNTSENGILLQDEMFSIVRAQDVSPIYLLGHLFLFMDLLIRTSSSRKGIQGGKIGEFYAREAINYIEQHYASNITVEDLAALCKLDRSYFGKVFKSVISQSPQEFLIRFRMEKAAEALTTTGASVGDISLSVGYANPLHFSRAFKNVYGVSPREYRQKNKFINRR